MGLNSVRCTSEIKRIEGLFMCIENVIYTYKQYNLPCPQWFLDKYTSKKEMVEERRSIIEQICMKQNVLNLQKPFSLIQIILNWLMKNGILKYLNGSLKNIKLIKIYKFKSKMDQHVARYQYINKMLPTRGSLPNKLMYEMKNIIERWLLTLCNDPSADLIFSYEKLNLKYPATAKMIQEMHEKKIPNVHNTVDYIIQCAVDYLQLTTYPKHKIVINNDVVKINQYQRQLPPGKLKILLELNPDVNLLGAMIMRYACLLVGGQQWALPLEIHRYMVERYKVTVEGFASPINSQILYINKNLNYCSVFKDDAPYGSLGSFFDQDFTGNIYANPPYINDIMYKMALKIIDSCSTRPVRFFITVPEWMDAEYYQLLNTSIYKVFDHGFKKGQHYYVDTNAGFQRIPAYFGTHLFVLSTIEDNYDDLINFMNQVYNL